MRKRNRTILLHLDDELAYLQDPRYKVRLTQGAYLRSLIAGVLPADKPPPDYVVMVCKLHAIVTHLDKVHLHNHFVINPVFFTLKVYLTDTSSTRQMRQLRDLTTPLKL